MTRSTLWKPCSACIAALTLAACSSNPTAPAIDPIATRANASLPPSITLNEFESSRLAGLVKVERDIHSDSLSADTLARTIITGYLGDAPGNDISASFAMNGVELARNDARDYFDTSASVALAEGEMAHWALAMKDGATFTDSILPPRLPALASLRPYQIISASAGLSGSLPGALNGTPLLVAFVYDSSRTIRLLGHGPQRQWRDSTATGVRAFDTGTLSVEPGVLRSLPFPAVYELHIYRMSYRAGARSDGKRVGMLAISSYSIPIIVQQ